MACQTIPMPEKLVLTDDDNENLKTLNMFILEWNNYYIASQLNKKDDKIQVASLMSALGRQGLVLVESLCLTDQEKKCTVTILKKLVEHLQNAVDVPYERFLFNSAKQEAGETIQNFVDRLRQLIKTCNYDVLQHDNIIRDRLLIGVRDWGLRKEMFAKKNITLKEALSVCRIAAQTQACTPTCTTKPGGASKPDSTPSPASVTTTRTSCKNLKQLK